MATSAACFRAGGKPRAGSAFKYCVVIFPRVFKFKICIRLWSKWPAGVAERKYKLLKKIIIYLKIVFFLYTLD